MLQVFNKDSHPALRTWRMQAVLVPRIIHFIASPIVFFGLMDFHGIHNISTQQNTHGPSLQISSMEISPSWISLNSNLSPQLSVKPRVIPGIPIVLHSSDCHQAEDQSNYNVHLICLFSLKDLSTTLPVVQCQKTIVSHILSCFQFFMAGE